MASYIESAINNIYREDDDFIVLGLTGRTGSGCSTAAKILCSHQNEITHSLYSGDTPQTNNQRKEKIVRKDFERSWQKFTLIQVRSIITLLLLDKSPNETRHFFENKRQDISKGAVRIFADLATEYKKLNIKLQEEPLTNDQFDFLFETLPSACELLKKNLSETLFVNLYQQIGKNIRLSGDPYNADYVSGKFFTLAKKVYDVIEAGHIYNKSQKKKSYFVIDALRNPFEALFFQDRYTSFFFVAISCSEQDRQSRLNKYGYSLKDIETLDRNEYKPANIDNESAYAIQDIQSCLQKADLYLSNPNIACKVDEFQWLANQLITFVSLIRRPGLITPSHIERCMQIAHTAKLNSGCISRQVGAVVTDSNFSIQAVGWNDVPLGQVPCNLRNRIDLATGKDKSAYSEYEKNNLAYLNFFRAHTSKLIPIQEKGRNLSFCFKAEYNSFTKEKNQVHTRSLHAEENAFLQIAKHGGRKIAGGILFTTASPCELCAKKAYQLGISEIYFIDPYPGIAVEHILQGGSKNPKLTLFSGAIGRAFHKLYSPIVPYKDELNALSPTMASGQPLGVTLLRKQHH
ncbi:hypothetical protein [Chitinimonas sp. JJ19]|uniref:hypothetical protein n=1 Tax=Chitinimonas sp. JJ19 TaxID=3109352 RepID=UPI003001D437